MLYSLSRRTVFDLDHLDGLSADPVAFLCVSETTLYILYNLVAADVVDSSRYAVELLPGGRYVPVAPEDEEWSLYVEVAERAQEEVQEVPSCFDVLRSIDHRVNPIEAKTVEIYGINSGSADPWIQSLGPVPSDEIWLVTQMGVRKHGGTFTDLYLNILRTSPGSISHTVDGPIETLLEAGDYHSFGPWYLGPGDSLRAFWYGGGSSLEATFKAAIAIFSTPYEEE